MRLSRIATGVLCAALLALFATDVSAQTRRGSARSRARVGTQHRFELVPYGGYRWTSSIPASRGLTTGEFDIKDSGFYGIALDINTPQPESQIRLAWDHQDSKMQYRSRGTTEEVDATVDYLQIGALRGVRNGAALPYGLVTLGATRYADNRADAWKFSIVLGLGAKYYVSDRIGIMAQARLPLTFLNTGLAIGIGTGGSNVAVTGTGVTQIDVGGGIMILL